MTEENAIVIPQVEGGIVSQSDEDFDIAVKGGSSFMGSLQLFTAKAEAVAAGLIAMKHWAKVMGKGEITDLGEKVDAYCLDWRAKALDFSGKEAIISFDAKSEEFTRIKEASATFGNSCMCGIEFLMYVPRIKEFLQYWATGTNAREEAKKLRPLMGKAVNLSSRLKIQGKFQNIVPVVSAVTAPIGEPPSDELLTAALTDFRNPRKRESQEAVPLAEGERPR